MSFLINAASNFIFGAGESKQEEGPEPNNVSSNAGDDEGLELPIFPPGHNQEDCAATMARTDNIRADAVGRFLTLDQNMDEGVLEEEAAIVLIEVDEYQFELRVFQASGDHSPLLYQSITQSMNAQFFGNDHSIVWTTSLPSGTYAWKFRFADSNSEQESIFKLQLAICLSETTRKDDFNKLVEDRYKEWVVDAYTADSKMEISDDDAAVLEQWDEKQDKGFSPTAHHDTTRFSMCYDNDSDDDRMDLNASRTQAALSSDDDDDDDVDYETKSYRSTRLSTPSRRQTFQETNNNLEVGMASNRTYIMRGSKIGVFKHDDDDQLDFLTKIPQIKTLDGEMFTPSKTMLHDRDSKLLMLNKDRPDKVFCMDLNRGEVVEEYDTGFEEWTVDNFGPSEKYAQRTGEDTITAVNRNSVFNLDPRMNEQGQVGHKFTYKAKPKLSCVATTGEGNIAVGSAKGEIRMFTNITKLRAKTLLPGLGDPIIGIDVSENGHYILATTEQYLLLVPTLIPDSTKTGFQMAMGNKRKPVPIKLTLDPKDILRHRIQQVSFTPATFNTGESIRENWIVTSTGPFIITWSLNGIKKGRRNAYKIKKAEQNVVADSFRFGRDDQVVVAEANNAYVEHRNY